MSSLNGNVISCFLMDQDPDTDPGLCSWSTSAPKPRVFGLWEEARVPRESLPGTRRTCKLRTEQLLVPRGFRPRTFSVEGQDCGGLCISVPPKYGACTSYSSNSRLGVVVITAAYKAPAWVVDWAATCGLFRVSLCVFNSCECVSERWMGQVFLFPKPVNLEV